MVAFFRHLILSIWSGGGSFHMKYQLVTVPAHAVIDALLCRQVLNRERIQHSRVSYRVHQYGLYR